MRQTRDHRIECTRDNIGMPALRCVYRRTGRGHFGIVLSIVSFDSRLRSPVGALQQKSQSIVLRFFHEQFVNVRVLDAEAVVVAFFHVVPRRFDHFFLELVEIIPLT